MKRDLLFHRRRAEEFVKKLSLQDKINIFYGTDEDKEKLGLSGLDFAAEAAHGVQARHDQSFDLGAPVFTTVFPNPIGMAASFDKKMMRRIGKVVGTETRSLANERLHNGLCPFAPTVDMERDPRWGRNEEAYGEDPHLASRLAGEYILGMAGDDPVYVRCGATLKHFYGNNVEQERFLSDSRMPEDLREDYYLRVFREIIEYAQPLSVMSSYNLINGGAATFNSEIRDKLKKWGVPYVVSDAFTLRLAVDKQHTAADGCDAMKKAFEAGVDLFLEDKDYARPVLEEALQKGIVTEEHLTEAVISRLTVFSALGLMKEDKDGSGCTVAFSKDFYNISKVDTPENRAVSREAAAKSAVLLKNDGMLPVADTVCSGAGDAGIVAFGPFVNRCPMDWYSGASSHVVTFAEGMNIPGEELFPIVRIKLGSAGFTGKADSDIATENGGESSEFSAGDNGTEVINDAGNNSIEVANDAGDNGTEVSDDADDTKRDGSFCEGLNSAIYYAGIRDGCVVPVSREEAELFSIMLWDESRMTIRSLSTGKLLTTISPDVRHKNMEESSEDFVLYANADDVFSWFANEAFQLFDRDGEVIRFAPEDALRFWEDDRICGISNFDGRMNIAFETVKDVDRLISDAVDKYGLVTKKGKGNSGTNVFACFGLHPIVNMKEERDRESIELPPFQRAVLRRLRQSFENIALILMGNAPLAVSEEDEVAEIRSIIWSAFGSEEFGNGLADVIKGRVSPAGRLPQTWYTGDDQLGSIDDYDIRSSGMTYLYMTEKPLYRFGYGLSYTEFESELIVENDMTGGRSNCEICGSADDTENRSEKTEKISGNTRYIVRIKNTGNVTSDHVIQLYRSESGEVYLYDHDIEGRDVTGRSIPSGSRMVYFERIHDVKPGEERLLFL